MCPSPCRNWRHSRSRSRAVCSSASCERVGWCRSARNARSEWSRYWNRWIELRPACSLRVPRSTHLSTVDCVGVVSGRWVRVVDDVTYDKWRRDREALASLSALTRVQGHECGPVLGPRGRAAVLCDIRSACRRLRGDVLQLSSCVGRKRNAQGRRKIAVAPVSERSTARFEI